MAYVLVDIENANGTGPFDTKKEAVDLADQLNVGERCILDYDAKVVAKWTNGEWISFSYGGYIGNGMFRFERAARALEADAEERKLLEWAEVSIRLADFVTYCMEMGVIAPAVFGQRDRLDVHQEAIESFCEEYVTQAQEAE